MNLDYDAALFYGETVDICASNVVDGVAIDVLCTSVHMSGNSCGSYSDCTSRFTPAVLRYYHSNDRHNMFVADENWQQCNSSRNLYIWGMAVVSDAAPLDVRYQPTTSSDVNLTLPMGRDVALMSGPVCEDNLVWWEIMTNIGGGWAAETYLHPYEIINDLSAGDSNYLSGTDVPLSSRYVYVPAVIHPDRLEIKNAPESTETGLGFVVPTYYYSLLDVSGAWVQVQTSNGTVGWIRTESVQIGNYLADVVEPEALDVNALISAQDTITNIYTGDNLPDELNQSREYLLDSLGRDTGNAASYTYVAFEVVTKRQVKASILCTPIDVIGDYTDSQLGNALDLACTAFDVATGVRAILRGSPTGLYITVFEITLDNLGPFVRWNDSVWMDSMNRYFGNCPLTSLFFGEDNACH
jgi:hypothetical protein